MVYICCLYVRLTFVSVVFRYHITLSGCELAKKLVEADAMANGTDCMTKPQDVNYNTKPTGYMKQSVPSISHFELAERHPPVATAAAVADCTATDSAVILGEDDDWQKELGFVLPEHDRSHQPR